jgi:large conductance mechanosensitive channel
MGFIEEFKEFAMKGNVVDLAVGVIIGGAFGKIVSSLVDNVITPAISFIVGGIDFSSLAYTPDFLKALPGIDPTKVAAIKYGLFIQSAFDFLIIAFVIFILVKALNSMKKNTPPAPPADPAPTREELLLGEIRDLLRNKG